MRVWNVCQTVTNTLAYFECSKWEDILLTSTANITIMQIGVLATNILAYFLWTPTANTRVTNTLAY